MPGVPFASNPALTRRTEVHLTDLVYLALGLLSSPRIPKLAHFQVLIMYGSITHSLV